MTRDIGASGLPVHGGRIDDDFLREWIGQNKIKRVTEMLKNSPVIGALRLAIEMPIRSIGWTFTSDRGEDDPRLELLNEALANLSHSWNDHVIDALLFPFYGWSMFTITYQRVGGKMLWRKFKQLGNETVYKWLMAEDGGLEGMQQYPQLYPNPIPIERMILYRFRLNRNNPEGESILRPAYTSYYYAKNLQTVEAITLERKGAGFPMIRMPQGADTTESTSADTDYGRATKFVRNIRIDEQDGLVLPFGWEFEFVAPPAGTTLNFGETITRYEKRMLMAALAQFLILGQDGVGSLSLSRDQSDFFALSVNSIADIIAETFTKYAVPRLMKLNGQDADGLRLEHTPAGDTDLNQLVEVLSKTGALLTWTPEDEEWLRQTVGLPEKTADELADLQAEQKAEQAQREQLQERLAEIRARVGNQTEAVVERNTVGKRFNDALSRFNSAVQRQPKPTPPPNITVNMPPMPDTHITAQMPAVTVNMPQPDHHEINVTMPELRQPEIRVNVQPAAVPETVVNVAAPNVTVEAPNVTVEAPSVTVDNTVEFPKRVSEITRVDRDTSGNITGATSEAEFSD